MRKVILIPTAIIAYWLLATTCCFSQGTAINTTGAAADNSALLDLSSTSKGMLIPRMTTTQRIAITNPADGLTIYNLDSKCFDYYNSLQWFTICGVPACSSAPSTPGAINGNNNPLPQQSGLVYSISPVSGATSYSWTVPTGWTITAGNGTDTITATSGTYGQNGNITVTASNLCGTSSPQTLAVTVGATPLSFANLWIWYDADDASSFTLSGSSVTQWNDKSGNNIHCSQSNGTYKPQRVTGVLNGKAIVRFNGTNTYLNTAPLQMFTTSSSPKTVILVFLTTNTAAGQRFILVHPHGAPSCINETEIGYSTGTQTVGNYGSHAGCGNATLAPDGTITNSVWNIMTMLYKSSGSTPNQLMIYKNGGSPLGLVTHNSGYWAAGNYPTQTTNLYVGGRVPNENDAYFNGDLAEVIIYNRQLSSSELNQLHSYLNVKYNISVSSIP